MDKHRHRGTFPLFQSHLDLAHQIWSQIVDIGDIVIDATCGNGHDTLKLCQIALAKDNEKGRVYAIDIQQKAIDSTRLYLASQLPQNLLKKVIFKQGCHSQFPSDLKAGTVKLVGYNLGYLPGSDKFKTTMRATTLESVKQAQELIQPGGVISITCYPGHPEGLEEQSMIVDFFSTLCPKTWSCCHHQWLNRVLAPTLLIVQKTLK